MKIKYKLNGILLWAQLLTLVIGISSIGEQNLFQF